MNNVEKTWQQGVEAMCALWDGATLLRSARVLAHSVATGPTTWVSTSTEGAALAAVCAALRDDGSSWRRVNLLSEAECPEFDGAVVFVEAIHPGAAWEAAIRARYPTATIASAATGYAFAAANAAAAA
jgi:hypothetical protein